MENNAKLRIIDISNNQIQQLSGLKQLSKLEEFWASSNLLGSFEDIEEQLKDKEELDTVYFEMNPLQTNQPVLYRNKVRLALPQIKQIDASKWTCLLLDFHAWEKCDITDILQLMYDDKIQMRTMFRNATLLFDDAQGNAKGLYHFVGPNPNLRSV